MSGKCRPSLRAKTLLSVARSNLSTADKKCIHAVFNLVDEQKSEIERLRTETRLLLANSVTELYPHCSFVDNGVFVSKEQDGYEKWNAYVRNQAYKEFALELKRIPRISVYKNEIDNLLREKVGDK